MACVCLILRQKCSVFPGSGERESFVCYCFDMFSPILLTKPD